MLAFSSSFFVIDFFALCIFRHNKRDIFFHHLVCIGFLLWSLHSKAFGWELAVAMALGELGPCIYLEQLAKKIGSRSKVFFLWNDTLYFFTFFVARVIFMTCLGVFVIMESQIPFWAHVASFGFWGLGIYWSVLIYRRYKKRYAGYSSPDVEKLA